MTQYVNKYTDNNNTILEKSQDKNPENLLFSIITIEEFKQKSGEFLHSKEILHSLGSVRYCKAEVFSACIWGTMYISTKSIQKEEKITFGFYLTAQKLVFIEDKGDLKRWIEKNPEKFENIKSYDSALLAVLELMIQNDFMYILHIENDINAIEETILDNSTAKFFDKITDYRKKLSELNSYYEQLVATGDVIRSHINLEMISDTDCWDRFTLRVERLQSHVRLLQENVLQIRELYQSRQDERQNDIMCVLTVVTTLFLPLTLLTGWYGMNFTHMPELACKYAYPVVIIIALLIITIELLFFKKHRFFKK